MDGLPKIQDKFFERPKIMDLLQKRVNALKKQYRQNIAILGRHSTGKTTLIFELLRRCKDIQFIPVYIDVKSKSIEAFTKNFIGVLLYQYLETENETLEDNFDYLVDKSKSKIPQVVRAILHINKLLKTHGLADEIYSLLLELPQILYDETKKPVLLILDEFHNLEHLGLSNPYLELSNKIMVQKHTMYIIVSSSVYNAQIILSEKLSLLFGNFEIIKLESLDHKMSKELMALKTQNLSFPESNRNFLGSFTGGYPFYLDVITDQIKRTCVDINTKNITEKILLTSLTETLFKEYGVLNQFFMHKYGKILETRNSNLFPYILLALAFGHKKPSQISNYLNRKTTEVNKYLNKLIEMDLVCKKGVFYYLNDPLFLNWIKFVLRPRQNSFNMDLQESVNNFENELKQLLEKFAVESKKEISQRLKEIFALFENDIIELDKKKFMLTQFDEIDIKNIDCASIVDAQRSKKHWFCYIAEKHLDENQVGELLINLKKSKKDYIKKILISLDGIDVNARLKALEAHFWIWDRNIVGELFSIFEKPNFIK